MAEKPKENPEEKKEEHKGIIQRLREAGHEVIINEKLMRAGGMQIIGARMPKPSDALPGETSLEYDRRKQKDDPPKDPPED